LLGWYKGPTFIDYIDRLKPPTRAVSKPFRLCIADVYRSLSIGYAIGGKLECGSIMVGDHVLLLPVRELLAVKAIERENESVKIARAGDNVEIGLSGMSDPSVLSVGQVLCDSDSPVSLVTKFRARLVTLQARIPIVKGSQLILFTHTSSQPVVVTKLISHLNKSNGQLIRKKPRCIPRNRKQ